MDELTQARLADRYGPPLTVEQARKVFGQLVGDAEGGAVVLVVRDGAEWAAVVPMTRIPDPRGCDERWTLTDAKAQLGPLVRRADRDSVTSVLTRHGRPVAAVVPASDVLEDQAAREDVEHGVERGAAELVRAVAAADRHPDGDGRVQELIAAQTEAHGVAALVIALARLAGLALARSSSGSS